MNKLMVLMTWPSISSKSKSKNPNKFIISTKPRKRVEHEWSQFQKNIFHEIENGSDNVIIVARAGSAKTSSMVEAANYLPKGKTAMFCAFSKSVAEELKDRLPKTVPARTTHSLGFAAIKNRFGKNVQLDNNKAWDIVEKLVDDPKDGDLVFNICQAVSFSKAMLIDTPTQIEEMIDQREIDLCDLNSKDFVKLVIQALRKCKEKTNVIDFDDMIWFCFVFGLKVGAWDVVMIDETQDLSKAQIELALSGVKKGGRVIAVLDDFQNIFSWRTGEKDILGTLRSRLNPKELMLPICYRCPKSVIRLSQTLVPDIQAFEKNEEGEVIDLSTNDLLKAAKPGCFVLSRFNAPLVKWAFTFLKNGIPANILGRDIGDGLTYLIKKSKRKTVDGLLNWLNEWEKKEKNRILTKNPRANVEFLTDKTECLRMMCEGAEKIEEVKENIEKLFKDGDENGVILLSSIHRSKGLEKDEVFVLADTLSEVDQENKNISYVSFTRARKKLFLVRKPSKLSKFDDPPKKKFKSLSDWDKRFDERNLSENNSSGNWEILD